MSLSSQPADLREYDVEGMTCSACEVKIQNEVSEVSGVEKVDADHRSGRMKVRGRRVSDDAVRQAVAVAGYRLI